MSEEVAISLSNVSKCFKRYDRPMDRLKEILIPRKSYSNDFFALRDINLEVYKGQSVGIVGRNGSGKSTLLQIIAGTLTATSGNVRVNGRVSALLELGSGFNLDFTGRQNVFFNGRILGLSQEEIENKFDDIAAFADIGDFIDQPVKTYSSGMFVRLAFAVAVNVEPDILIVDEALAVGDGIFVHKCMAKIRDFQDLGGTILFVSHDLSSVSRLCSQSVWINHGSILEQGIPTDISKLYQAWVYEKINKRIKEVSESEPNVLNKENIVNNIETGLECKLNKQSETSNQQNAFTGNDYLSFPNTKRFGTGRCEILSLEVLNSQSQKTGFVMPDDWLILKTKIITHDNIHNPIFGITMFDRLRVPMAGWNTTQYNYQLPKFTKNQLITVSFKIHWPHIKSDSYSLEPAVADGSQHNHEMMDWLLTCISIQSGVTDLTFGFIRFTEVAVHHTVQDSVDNELLNQILST